MADILNKCPVCGSELEYKSLNRFIKVYKILPDGKLSNRVKRVEDTMVFEEGFISCVKCNFHTNTELQDEGNKINIKQFDGKFYIM